MIVLRRRPCQQNQVCRMLLPCRAMQPMYSAVTQHSTQSSTWIPGLSLCYGSLHLDGFCVQQSSLHFPQTSAYVLCRQHRQRQGITLKSYMLCLTRLDPCFIKCRFACNRACSPHPADGLGGQQPQWQKRRANRHSRSVLAARTRRNSFSCAAVIHNSESLGSSTAWQAYVYCTESQM